MSIIKTMNNWFAEFGRRKNFTLVHYESLRAAPEENFRTILATLGENSPDPEAFKHALEFSAFANMQRILAEIVPRVMMKDPATLLKMTTALNEVYTKTGVNLLSIDRIAGGLQFIGPPTHAMKKDNLGIAIIVHGDFDADTCTVECPRHGSLFDLRTGKPKTLPAYVPVDTFPVIIADDLIKLEVE